MLENYRIFKELTRSQHCQLLLAQHVQTGQKCVLKTPLLILEEGGLSEEEQLARFRRECSIHLYLRHESIVPAIESFESEGQPYLVTQYKPYETLRALLSRKVRFSPLEALSLIQQLCQALHYIHDQGVIHRDIHPENILITEENRIFLIDFGCARKVFAPNITQEKLVNGALFLQGTLYYMSPEQLLGQTDLDFRADVFSAGVILYQLLTHQLPFEGEELQDMVQNLLSRDPHPICSINPYIPASLQEMVFQALRKDPDYRTPTARKLALEIEALLEDPELYYCEARWRLEQTRSIDSAQEYGMMAFQKNPKHVPALRLLGQIFMQRQQYDKARSCYERILEQQDHQADIYFSLGQIAQKQKDLLRAYTHFEHAMLLDPDAAIYQMALAQTQLDLGRYAPALELAQDLLQAAPDSLDILLLAAKASEGIGDQIQSLDFYLKARDIEPLNLNVLKACAALQHELGLYQEALVTYQSLSEQEPTNREIQHNLANVYYLLDELGESRVILENLIEKNKRPREVEWEMTYRLLGFVYTRLSLYYDAIESYKYTILCNAQNLENYLFLASAYRDQLQIEDALQTLKYVSEQPFGRYQALVYFLMARAYFEQGKDEEAKQALETCLTCYETLTDTMARQVEEDLSKLYHRHRERQHSRRSLRSGFHPQSHKASNILSFPTHKRGVV